MEGHTLRRKLMMSGEADSDGDNKISEEEYMPHGLK